MSGTNQNENGPRIIRAKLGEICVYDVTEDELVALESGSPGSLQLNFAIALLSVASSFLISLLTTTIEPIYKYVFFLVVTLIGFIAGFFFLINWFRSYRNLNNISKRIRDRRSNISSSSSPSPSEEATSE